MRFCIILLLGLTGIASAQPLPQCTLAGCLPQCCLPPSRPAVGPWVIAPAAPTQSQPQYHFGYPARPQFAQTVEPPFAYAGQVIGWQSVPPPQYAPMQSRPPMGGMPFFGSRSSLGGGGCANGQCGR